MKTVVVLALSAMIAGAAQAQAQADYPNMPEMKVRLAESTIDASPTTPEEFATFIQKV